MRNHSIRAFLCGVLLTSLVIVGGTGCASSGKKKGPKRTVLLTRADDVRVGAEAAKEVEASIGLLDDPDLTAYVQGIGKKLLRGLPYREFAYSFSIVDQMEPNAFALPGGHIYVSRGLLALVNNEDELACVIGHEIVHVAKRHSAQQQAVARYQGFSLPRSRAATMAAYGRNMEREADSLGQRLCGAAGYDPMGMSTFMRSLDKRDRLLIGQPRAPTFLDTHPGSRERAADNSMRASELRWIRDARLGNVRVRYLDRIDGMLIGDRPETGLFVGQVFIHPVLDFEMDFPKGWHLQNSSRAVGAIAPRGEAAVFLSADVPPGNLIEAADKFAEEAASDYGIELTEKKRVKIGKIEGVRYGFQGGSRNPISAKVTFFPFAEANWRMVGVAPRRAEGRYFGAILLSMRSFRPLTAKHRTEIRIERLHVVLARSGEDLVAFNRRTSNILSAAATGLFNGRLGNQVFEGGELMKVVRNESVDLP